MSGSSDNEIRENQPTVATEVAKAETNGVDDKGLSGSGADSGGVNVREIGGPPGPEPTRYGDWEKNGRCIDF